MTSCSRSCRTRCRSIPARSATATANSACSSSSCVGHLACHLRTLQEEAIRQAFEASKHLHFSQRFLRCFQSASGLFTLIFADPIFHSVFTVLLPTTCYTCVETDNLQTMFLDSFTCDSKVLYFLYWISAQLTNVVVSLL